MQKQHKYATMLSAKAATGYSVAYSVSDFKNASIALIGTGATVGLTFKICGSVQDTAPTFSTAQSATNVWDYIDVLDMEDGSSIDGDTGIAFAAADVRQFEVNTENLQWIGVQVSALTNGTGTAILSASDNS